MKKIIYDLDNIDHIVSIILDYTKSKVLCFSGNLGSGKTTLIKRFLRKLDAVDHGSSPTFGIINEYNDSNDQRIAFHLDCYRLKSVDEALDIGLEEYLESNCWAFIEWPEKIAGLLPVQRTEIDLRILNSDTRELVMRNLPD